jgi:hypothetical protein
MDGRLTMLGRLRNQVYDLGAIHWLSLIFVIYAVAGSTTLSATAYFISLVVAFTLGSIRDYNPRNFWLGYLLLAVLMFLIPLIAAHWLAINPNILGAALAIGFAAALTYEVWLFAAFTGGAVIFTQSRTAIIAAGAALLIWLWREYKFIALLLVISLGALLITSSQGRSTSLYNRLGIWQDTLAHLTFWGSGLGSFASAYVSWPMHTNMLLETPVHAYNDYLELIFELGIGAIPFWLMLILLTDKSDIESNLILLTFGILSLSFFPLYIPIIAHLFAFCLGYLAITRRRQQMEAYA